MIVVSLDPITETVSMVSIPRDMVDVPLADGRKYRGKINGLVAYARHHPKQFPGSDGTGLRRPPWAPSGPCSASTSRTTPRSTSAAS